jgi:hypothetical protein
VVSDDQINTAHAPNGSSFSMVTSIPVRLERIIVIDNHIDTRSP